MKKQMKAHFLKKAYPLLPLTTLAVSVNACDSDRQKTERPNILVILADDMGYSDPGCYGGEIQTPHLDRLAQNGVRFSRFYNGGKSCPTRSALLTGLYPHQAGVGRMTFDAGLPGYRGNMTHNGVTIAEVLQTAGYQTGMIGKWHVAETPLRQDQRQWLAHQVQYDNFAPIDNYPVRRGFQNFYGTIYGVVNYFDPFSLVNGEEPVQSVPKGYYSTIALADSAAAYINRYARSDSPFFLYLAFHSPHWPLHALPEDIKKYEDVYKAGWETIRKKRYERIRETGIFDRTKDFLSERHFSDAWEENASDEWDAHAMAVHAAMIDRMDQEIGKIIRTLEKTGELDNTVILFLSDNGCSSESCQMYSEGENDRPAELRNGDPMIYPRKKEVLPGEENVWASIGAKWANVANTPFRFWKGTMYEGGICTPAILHWSKGLKAKKGSVISDPCHVIDIMATCLELAQAKYPESYNGNNIIPLEGISFLPALKGQKHADRHEVIGFEHFNEKALIAADGWKIVRRPGQKKEWELYDLNADRTEMHDVASQYPDRVAQMVAKYEAWAARCLVEPAPK
ncbi:MAG: arylsulfatase [Bacteroidales bacterium]|jgi:arylsulfatase|nr:arylsulfatase [Bacteroidales bacterium]